MKTLSIDLETFSSTDLRKTGVYRYVEAHDFEILLFGYSVDDGDVHVVDLAQGEKIPGEILAALTDDTVTKWAFNANFERICLSRHLGLPTGEYLDPTQWRCSMVWSAYLGLPLSLAGVGAVLKLDKQKLTEGKDLIKYFCQPCKPTKVNGGRLRNYPVDAPEKWALFKSYNLRDVETEMEVQSKLSRFPVPDFVWDEYHLDQEINDLGIRLDMTLVKNAIAMDTQSRDELTDAMQKLTALDNPNSVAQMKSWLAGNGLETESLGKKQVAELLVDAPKPLADVLLLRQQLAKSSVRKYQAMENCVCADGRARGMFMFYGANRTGRFSGRLIQLQNLPQNHMPDLAQARVLVRSNDYKTLHLLYDSVPNVLSELIRTAFVPYEGGKFIVSDFSAIEARVIAWLAGEEWKTAAFARGDDIYCATASQMFQLPVEKHGANSQLRQKGKITELACIAEGQLVLTHLGLVPIENVTKAHLLWDGESWVPHRGVIYKGEREVIEYEGLTATPDHLVWVEGQKEPIHLGIAAAGRAHLVRTGDGGRAIRLGQSDQPGETLECKMESLLHSDAMPRLRKHPVAESGKSDKRKIKRMSALFTATSSSSMAGQASYCRKAAVRKSKRRRIQKLRRSWCSFRVSQRSGSRPVPDRSVWNSQERTGTRSNRQQRKLCSGKSQVYQSIQKQFKQTQHSFIKVRSTILAVCEKCCYPQTVKWAKSGGYHSGRGNRNIRETQELENHFRTARLYDIRDAGPNHRFTVSGKLVHNCGYGGSVGALKAMGALEMGLSEEELKPLVDAWRASNPNIVQLWWDVDRATKACVIQRLPTQTHGIRFAYESGFLFITLPSGRRLAYVKPRIGVNRFGGESITYEGIGNTKKWERLESYGPKFVENIIQAISRDILCYAMQTLRCCNIVAHVHDEIIIEADPRMSLQAVCEQMGRTPPWAPGLELRADGFITEFYQKN